jgi:NTP pyrophosphatase (non-canonical NTP hydrolase)
MTEHKWGGARYVNNDPLVARIECLRCGQWHEGNDLDKVLSLAKQEGSKCVPTQDFSLRAMQREHNAWKRLQLGAHRIDTSLMGLVEETGELAGAIRKERQGIDDQHKLIQKQRSGIADITMCLVDICNVRGWDYEEIVANKWAVVKQRDYRAGPIDYEGEPEI